MAKIRPNDEVSLSLFLPLKDKKLRFGVSYGKGKNGFGKC